MMSLAASIMDTRDPLLCLLWITCLFMPQGVPRQLPAPPGSPLRGHHRCQVRGPVLQLSCLDLQCHGEGHCTSVPQLPEGQPLSKTRSCVASYPTRCAEGLLWVWPDASPVALIESAAEDAWPGLAPEIDQLGDTAFSKAAAKHKWYAR